ncbi:cobalt transport protein CbiM [Methanococcus vannielii SB]|jgi:cobalt/nickel transport protein|uniref:Cobalt transport protein CbiM n=1 Tax=Methanococcus vannielii (strain ATCC 35089 / DSM 1224 / JCM 13029 / OCM 148 / SB) TaxID=406327 RepID=A6UN75_METVS|nr:PDGLE domain-containing protein [Methanococcus vannielii]ABR53947.1 cobalt transport protein CbiM [Methanococcus vannielii SB]
MNKNNKVIVFGLTIALVIGLLAPFLASGNPDGLESAAEKIMNEHILSKNLEEIGLEEEGTIIPSPMPDYSISGMEKLGEVIAMIIGIFVMTAFAFLVGSIFKNSSSKN